MDEETPLTELAPLTPEDQQHYQSAQAALGYIVIAMYDATPIGAVVYDIVHHPTAGGPLRRLPPVRVVGTATFEEAREYSRRYYNCDLPENRWTYFYKAVAE